VLTTAEPLAVFSTRYINNGFLDHVADNLQIDSLRMIDDGARTADSG
jgi:hypothetical protein